MKIERQINGGKFSADGMMIEPTSITVSFMELTLEDYKEVSTKLATTFKVDPPESILRRFQRVVVTSDNHQVHGGGNPAMGRMNDLKGAKI